VSFVVSGHRSESRSGGIGSASSWERNGEKRLRLSV